MAKQWLSWISLGIGSAAALLLAIAMFIFFFRSEEIPLSDSALTKRNLPPCAFAMSKQACDAIGKAAFNLKFAPITLQIPDLKNHITYYGKNGRPDAPTEKPVLHFAVNTNPTFAAPVVSGERLYLFFDRKKNPPQYAFSLNNEETSLWLEPTVQGNEAVVKVVMRNENGELVKEPEANAIQRFPERENRANQGKNWEIGKQRVDGSLLARQKARWMGQDLFLDRHGGDEFKDFQGKQRIDFVDEALSYSVYVALNDSVIWDNDQWKVAKPGQATLGFPLMVVKKIEDRLMNFELWDVGGKNKVMLNLVKSIEPWNAENIKGTFKFLGARTRSQFIFEIDEERVLLSPQDWLLETSEGWVKLSTPQQIDDYVERKTTGILFVCSGLEKKEGQQILNGVFFNPARTEICEVELPVQQGFGHAAVKAKKETAKEEEDKDDDEDDDDDEDYDDEDDEDEED